VIINNRFANESSLINHAILFGWLKLIEPYLLKKNGNDPAGPRAGVFQGLIEV